MRTDRWYYVEINEHNRQEPIFRFVGKLYKTRDDDGVFIDQDGWWYFTWGDADVLEEGIADHLVVDTEVAFTGNTFAELAENMREWVNEILDGKWPEVMKVPERSTVGLETDYDT